MDEEINAIKNEQMWEDIFESTCLDFQPLPKYVIDHDRKHHTIWKNMTIGYDVNVRIGVNTL